MVCNVHSSILFWIPRYVLQYQQPQTLASINCIQEWHSNQIINTNMIVISKLILVLDYVYRLLLFIKLRFQVFQFIPIIKSIIWKYCKILNRIWHCLSWWYFYFLVILISDGFYVFLICWTYTYNMFVFGIPLLLNLTLDCHKDKNQVWWSQLKWEGSHNNFFRL